MKKNQQVRSRGQVNKNKGNLPNLRTADDMKRVAQTAAEAFGMFGAIVGGIAAFVNAASVTHSVKEKDTEPIDVEAEVVSSQIKK